MMIRTLLFCAILGAGSAFGQTTYDSPSNKVDYARVKTVTKVTDPQSKRDVYMFTAEYNGIPVAGASRQVLHVGGLVRVRVVTSVTPAE